MINSRAKQIRPAPYYVSNDVEQTVAELEEIPAHPLERLPLDVAMGYFKQDVWLLISDAFNDLEGFPFPLGTVRHMVTW